MILPRCQFSQNSQVWRGVAWMRDSKPSAYEFVASSFWTICVRESLTWISCSIFSFRWGKMVGSRRRDWASFDMMSVRAGLEQEQQVGTRELVDIGTTSIVQTRCSENDASRFSRRHSTRLHRHFTRLFYSKWLHAKMTPRNPDKMSSSHPRQAWKSNENEKENCSRHLEAV